MASRIAMAGAILVAGWLGINPAGLRRRGGRAGLRSRRLVDLPGADDGHLRQARMNSMGAIAGMLAGLVHPDLHLLVQGLVLHSRHQHGANTPDNWLFGISPGGLRRGRRADQLHRGLGVVSRHGAPPEHIQHLVEDIRVPKGAGEATGH
jgi:cation/acetate symporter